MSSYGLIQAQLNERIRIEGVIAQCKATIELARESLSSMNNSAEISAFLGDTRKLESRIDEMSSKVALVPDQALADSKLLLKEVTSMEVSARAAHMKWNDERMEAEKAVKVAISFARSTKTYSKGGAAEAASILTDLEALRSGKVDLGQMKARSANLEKAMTLLGEREAKEWERKEVVRRLMDSLRKMGFSISGPTISEGLVKVVGTQPSGRKVLFEIRPDSHLHFEFEGYSGETCKSEMNGVLEILMENGVESEIEQFQWHNPDKIKKGAKEMPQGPAQTMGAKR